MKNTGMPTHRRYEEERRRCDRRDVRAPAKLVLDEGVLIGQIDNISVGGASFSTQDVAIELEHGARILLRAALPTSDGTRRVEKAGRILRSEDYFDGDADVITYAIAFDEPLSEQVIDDIR